FLFPVFIRSPSLYLRRPSSSWLRTTFAWHPLASGTSMTDLRSPASPAASRSSDMLLIAGIMMIAVNLRPALAAVGPLVAMIRDSTGLSNTMLGLLTTMPLLAFAGISLVASLVTRRYGIPGMLAAAMGLLTIGILVRSIPSVFALYIGTLLLGIAIAFGNVLLPGL